MKKLILGVSVCIVGYSLSVFAQDEKHPCKQILNQCESAGFYVGGAKVGKGAYLNCLDQLIDNKPVPNVVPDPKLLSSCQAKPHPCLKIIDACEAAGFGPNQAKTGKGLGKNCEKPILAGQSVPGVVVDPTTVQACIALKAKVTDKK